MRQRLDVKRILVVDDDADTGITLSKYLRDAGFDVDFAQSSMQALDHVEKVGLPDLAVLDIVMPGLNGLDVADRLHGYGDIPIVFVSKLCDVEMKITILKNYGDDYMTKPVNPAIFVARIRRVLNRHPGPIRLHQEVNITPTIRVNFDRCYLINNGYINNLTPIEASILKLLFDHRGQVVSREHLLQRVRSADALFVHIRRLRSKIEVDPSKPQFLQTARGHGYYLD